MKKTKKLIIGIALIMLMMCMVCFSASAETEENGFSGCHCVAGWYFDSGSHDEETGVYYVDIGVCTGYTGNEHPDGPFYMHDPLTEANIGSTYTVKGSIHSYDLGLVSISSRPTVTKVSIGSCKDVWVADCENLTSVKIGGASRSVYLEKCPALKELSIGLTEELCIKECDGLEKITIPHGVEYLEIHSSTIKSITLPGSLIEFDLSNCTSLETVVLSPGITEISSKAFMNCVNLKNVQIPNTVTSIDGWTEEGAFSGCTSLEKIDLPDSITHIGDSAFENTGLKNLPDLKNVTDMGDCVFYNCQNLETVTVNSKALGSLMFFYCEKLKEIILPEGITEIPASFAEGCVNLEKITIPDGVTRIEELAFYNCTSLQRINLPNSIEFIGEYALRNTGLKDIYYDGTKAEWGEIVVGYTTFPLFVNVHYNSGSASVDCTCSCHKTGFSGIIWKILRIFYKLFRTNPVCACGAAHY